MPPPIKKKVDPIQAALALSQREAKQRRSRGLTADTSSAETNFRSSGSDSGYDIEKPIPMGQAGTAPAPIPFKTEIPELSLGSDKMRPLRKRKLTVALK